MHERKIKLYTDYCLELEQYDPIAEDFPYDKAREVAESYYAHPAFDWISITDGDEEVGFLITAHDLDVFGKGLYICEAYVEEAHRRKGLMTATVQKALSNCKTAHLVVHLETFLGNPAASFWAHRLTEAGFKEVFSRESPLTKGAIHWKYEREDA